MAWMIVKEEVNYRRPNGPFFHVKPKEDPQCYPRDVVAFAVKNNLAKHIRSPSRGEAKPNKL